MFKLHKRGTVWPATGRLYWVSAMSNEPYFHFPQFLKVPFRSWGKRINENAFLNFFVVRDFFFFFLQRGHFIDHTSFSFLFFLYPSTAITQEATSKIQPSGGPRRRQLKTSGVKIKLIIKDVFRVLYWSCLMSFWTW